jgi:hypothetical protein
MIGRIQQSLVLLVMVAACLLANPQARCDPATEPTTEPTATTLPTTAPAASITVTTCIEDNQKLLRAVVTSAGKPVENATVVFTAHRLFGELLLGQDKTLDDGSAAINFPNGLPGGVSGDLDITATVQAPAEIAGAKTQARVSGGRIVKPASDEQPRELWSRQSSWPLRAIVLGLVALAWGTYLIAIRQLMWLRKGV